MDVTALLADIDAEITRLKQARAALEAIGSSPAKRGPGRPKSTATKKTGKRSLSPEARARIAAAQKKRWAAQKKAQ